MTVLQWIKINVTRHKIKFLWLVVLFILLFDFFILSKLDVISRNQKGYQFVYPSTLVDEWQNTALYGSKRIAYNFDHFCLFWLKMPEQSNIHSFHQLITQDGNPLWMNLSHFACFFLFTLFLIWWFKLKRWQAILFGFLINIFHEYIAEGIYVDPSFIDLWLDTAGILFGILISLLGQKLPYYILIFSRNLTNALLKNK